MRVAYKDRSGTTRMTPIDEIKVTDTTLEIELHNKDFHLEIQFEDQSGRDDMFNFILTRGFIDLTDNFTLHMHNATVNIVRNPFFM